MNRKKSQRSGYDIDQVIIGSARINTELSEFIGRLQTNLNELHACVRAVEHAIELVLVEFDDSEVDELELLDHLRSLRSLHRHLDMIEMAESGF